MYQFLMSHPAQQVRSKGKQDAIHLLCHQGYFKKALQMADAFYVTDSIESSPFAWGFVFLQHHIYLSLQEDSAAIEKILQCRDILTTFPEEFASQISPIFRTCQMSLARTLELHGDSKSADSIMAELDIYYKNNPDPTELQNYLSACGIIEFHRGNFDKALEYAESLHIPEQRQPFSYTIMIGRCYMGAGKLGEAITFFEKAMNQYDEDRASSSIAAIKAHYWLGHTRPF
jgi:tetratricopeptide (TPR) repeat protein